jgi:hypothetical protein
VGSRESAENAKPPKGSIFRPHLLGESPTATRHPAVYRREGSSLASRALASVNSSKAVRGWLGRALARCFASLTVMHMLDQLSTPGEVSQFLISTAFFI